MSSAVFTETSEGKAGAINIAGSLRMQSYLIASQTADPHLSRAEKRERVERGLANFESRVNNPVLTGSLPGDERAALQRTYREVSTMWRERIRPAAEAALADSARESAFLAMVPGFVGRVDHLVTLFEEDLESRIRTLRLYQGIALFLIVFVIFAAMYLMHTQVLVPLSDLLAASRAVRRGDFRVRAAHTGADELGQLGHAFNYMVEDLSAMYANLEARVAEQTEELARTNRSLELLYNTTRTLSERALTNETLSEVLRDVEVMIKGYWRNPKATAENLRGGWVHTGDLEIMDEKGYVYILDRAKDMIISGGENIYSREIEDVILKHPAIHEVAVIGVPDEKQGEAVKAIVSLKQGQTTTGEVIINFCKDYLASYKKPKSVEFVKEIPKNPYGKVLKRELREKYWVGEARRVR